MTQTQAGVESGYAPVNGLRMYYELHGDAAADRPPLLLLHGSFLTIGPWGEFLPLLARTRRVAPRWTNWQNAGACGRDRHRWV